MGTTTVTSAQLASYRAASTSAMKAAVAKRLREAGQIIADAARAASSTFSSRIPGTIKVTGGTVEVYIVAGGDTAPNAYPFEYGTYHPVFAKGDRSGWTWRKQPLRPFLADAAEAMAEPAAEAFSAVLDDWIAQL